MNHVDVYMSCDDMYAGHILSSSAISNPNIT